MKRIKLYCWFIKESQRYMDGHNRAWVFFKSLQLGFKSYQA